jgi:hypothetical protein
MPITTSSSTNVNARVLIWRRQDGMVGLPLS